MRKENGITLVALVVTIVILLMISGVTIASLSGENGLVKKAIEARNKNDEVSVKEEMEIEVMQSFSKKGEIEIDRLNNRLKRIKGLIYNNNQLSDINKITELPVVVEVGENSYQIKDNGKVLLVKPQAIGSLTKDNYGDYLDLGKSIVGTSSTSDDWRIIYNDQTDKKVYAILADYLPNSTGIATSAGLEVIEGKEYNATNTTSRAKLVECFDSTIWKERLLANSFQSNSKITVKGAMKKDKIFASYNEKHDVILDTDPYTWQYLYLDPDDTSKGIDTLYMPHPGASSYNGCEGYWLYSIRAAQGMWSVFYDGGVKNNAYNKTNLGVLPVVILESDINVNAEKIDNKVLWSIIQ